MSPYHLARLGGRPEPVTAAPEPKIGDRYILADDTVTAIIAEGGGVYHLHGSDLRWTFSPSLDGSHVLRARVARSWSGTLHVARPA